VVADYMWGVKEKEKSRRSYMVGPFTEMENSVEKIEVTEERSECMLTLVFEMSVRHPGGDAQKQCYETSLPHLSALCPSINSSCQPYLSGLFHPLKNT